VYKYPTHIEFAVHVYEQTTPPLSRLDIPKDTALALLTDSLETLGYGTCSIFLNGVCLSVSCHRVEEKAFLFFRVTVYLLPFYFLCIYGFHPLFLYTPFDGWFVGR
jgi:hypothetical protein